VLFAPRHVPRLRQTEIRVHIPWHAKVISRACFAWIGVSEALVKRLYVARTAAKQFRRARTIWARLDGACGSYSSLAIRFGIKEHRIAGPMLRVFSPAKTVADCLKFRNKIGVDVAIEALKECRRTKKATMDEVWAITPGPDV
jgi:hypothetical protein